MSNRPTRVADMKTNIVRLLSENAKLKRERDEAREKYDTLSVENMLAVNKLCKERDEARDILREIATASHFDNIGNWARNKAKKALE